LFHRSTESKKYSSIISYSINPAIFTSRLYWQRGHAAPRSSRPYPPSQQQWRRREGAM